MVDRVSGLVLAWRAPLPPKVPMRWGGYGMSSMMPLSSSYVVCGSILVGVPFRGILVRHPITELLHLLRLADPRAVDDRLE